MRKKITVICPECLEEIDFDKSEAFEDYYSDEYESTAYNQSPKEAIQGICERLGRLGLTSEDANKFGELIETVKGMSLIENFIRNEISV